MKTFSDKQPRHIPEVQTLGNAEKKKASQEEKNRGNQFHIPGWKGDNYAYGISEDNQIDVVTNNGDDYFDKTGNYLGSSVAETNEIRIITDDSLSEKLRQNGAPQSINPEIANPLSSLLASFNYGEGDIDQPNVLMLKTIAGYYAFKAGINADIKVERVKKAEVGGLAFFHIPDADYPDGYYALAITLGGNLNAALNNKYAMINSFVHEKNHHDDPNTRNNPLNHVNAVITQSNHETWMLAPRSFRSQTAMYAGTLLNEALKNGASIDAVQKKIDELNASPVAKGAEFYYDETEKTVVPMIMLDGIEIQSDK